MASICIINLQVPDTRLGFCLGLFLFSSPPSLPPLLHCFKISGNFSCDILINQVGKKNNNNHKAFHNLLKEVEAADRAEGEATIVDEGLDKNLFCANKKSDLIKGKKLLWMKKAKAIKKTYEKRK